MRSLPIRPGFRPYPKTPCNGEAAQGTIPVRPPSPGASRMPQTLRVTQSVLLSASFFLFLETGAGGRLNGPPDSCGAVYTKRPCFLRILSGIRFRPCNPSLLISVPARATRRFAISKSALKWVARPILAVEANSLLSAPIVFTRHSFTPPGAGHAPSVSSSPLLRMSFFRPLSDVRGAWGGSLSDPKHSKKPYAKEIVSGQDCQLIKK